MLCNAAGGSRSYYAIQYNKIFPSITFIVYNGKHADHSVRASIGWISDSQLWQRDRCWAVETARFFPQSSKNTNTNVLPSLLSSLLFVDHLHSIMDFSKLPRIGKHSIFYCSSSAHRCYCNTVFRELINTRHCFLLKPWFAMVSKCKRACEFQRGT